MLRTRVAKELSVLLQYFNEIVGLELYSLHRRSSNGEVGNADLYLWKLCKHIFTKAELEKAFDLMKPKPTMRQGAQ